MNVYLKNKTDNQLFDRIMMLANEYCDSTIDKDNAADIDYSLMILRTYINEVQDRVDKQLQNFDEFDNE